MASSLSRILVEAVNLEHSAKGASGPRDCKVERKPQPQMVQDESEAVSKSALEHRGVRGDPDVVQSRNEVSAQQDLMRESSQDSDPELGVFGEELSSGELTAQIVVDRTIPISIPDTSHVFGPTPSMSHTQYDSGDFDALGYSDLLEDTKFYQDTAVEYQSTFYSIQDRYSEQACLLEEASGALQAMESKMSQTQQECLALRRNHDNDIQQAVGRAVYQYQTQLNAAQSCTH